MSRAVTKKKGNVNILLDMLLEICIGNIQILLELNSLLKKISKSPIV